MYYITKDRIFEGVCKSNIVINDINHSERFCIKYTEFVKLCKEQGIEQY